MNIIDKITNTFTGNSEPLLRRPSDASDRFARAEALEANKAMLAARHEQTTAEFREQIAAADQDLARRFAALDDQEAAEYTRLAKALCEDFHATLAPLAREWIEGEPSRRVATGIADAIATFDARARRELREPTGSEMHSLSAALVASAFADVVLDRHPRAVAKFIATDWGSMYIERAAHKVMRSHGGPELVGAIEELEAALISTAVATPEHWSADHFQRRGYEIKRECATSRDLFLAREAHDREQAQRAQQAFSETYVPPPRLYPAVT